MDKTLQQEKELEHYFLVAKFRKIFNSSLVLMPFAPHRFSEEFLLDDTNNQLNHSTSFFSQ
jgi:hypothetical protein